MLSLNTNLVQHIPHVMFSLPFIGVIDLQRYIAAFIVFAVLSVVFWLLRTVIIVRLQAWSAKTSTDIDDTVVHAAQSVRPWVYLLISIYVALQLFTLPALLWKIITGIVLLAVVHQVIEISLHFVGYATRRFVEKDADGDGLIDPNAATASHMVTLIARITLWSLGGLFVLSNLGIEITSLIAGLGIGGIAVAFALQGILSDLFASFSLYFDKPFRIGDFILIGNDMGTVERIGIKTTRIRTLQGEELVVSNNELTTTRVQNFKKMEERRIVFRFGVTYETKHDKVKSIPGVVERIFGSIEHADLDRVHFVSFGDSALLFEVVYFAKTSDYTEYLNMQQTFNFALMDKFTELGIEFAHPTQTLYVKNQV